MRRWRVEVDVSGVYASTLHGLITYAFEAGTVTPASEEEELVLAELLSRIPAPPPDVDEAVVDGDDVTVDEDGEPYPPEDIVYIATELAPVPDDPRLASRATREQLAEVATERGLDVPENLTKAEIRALLGDAEQEEA